jgi:hypothetical protein
MPEVESLVAILAEVVDYVQYTCYSSLRIVVGALFGFRVNGRSATNEQMGRRYNRCVGECRTPMSEFLADGP